MYVQKMPGQQWQQRDSPNQGGLYRKESMEYGHGNNQGFVSGNPAKSRPSPVRGQSPQDIGPPIATFPNQPQVRRNTPGGVRRTSADRRGNSPSTQHHDQIDEWLCPHCRKKNPRRTDNASCHYCHRPRPMNSVNSQWQGTPTTAMGKMGTPERRHPPSTTTAPVDDEKTKAAAQATQEKQQELDKILAVLIKQHIAEPDYAALGPHHEEKNIIQIMKQIEKAFWMYLDDYATNPAYPKAHKFEKGLLKEFTYEVLKKLPNLCGLLSVVPRGGLDCEKGEINVKSVAGSFFKTLCEYKMTEPVAGGVLVTPDLKKMLLVKNKLCGNIWTLPKGKVTKDDIEAAAIHHTFDQTGISIAPQISKSKKVTITIDRGNVKQQQTLFIVLVDEMEFPGKDAAWKPLSVLPHVENIHLKQPALNKKPTQEFENVSIFLKRLADPLGQMVQNLKAGRAPEGPAVELTETPTPVLHYMQQREKMLQSHQFGERWKRLTSKAPTVSTSDHLFVNKRNAVKTKLFAELAKINLVGVDA
eukprot:TRINITY_DN6140_c2_g2_i1.p1 TRINITY_DN6140_c2_g2~~TRINITY_DN6140_c2_g2_i1.p1  ORF type:complete len:553 (+),score=109.42 TRINITY_DN6140_c2_g2_i1:77-1660(+)